MSSTGSRAACTPSRSSRIHDTPSHPTATQPCPFPRPYRQHCSPVCGTSRAAVVLHRCCPRPPSPRSAQRRQRHRLLSPAIFPTVGGFTTDPCRLRDVPVVKGVNIYIRAYTGIRIRIRCRSIQCSTRESRAHRPVQGHRGCTGGWCRGARCTVDRSWIARIATTSNDGRMGREGICPGGTSTGMSSARSLLKSQSWSRARENIHGV